MVRVGKVRMAVFDGLVLVRVSVAGARWHRRVMRMVMMRIAGIVQVFV